jgi:hypothetical protein
MKGPYFQAVGLEMFELTSLLRVHVMTRSRVSKEFIKQRLGLLVCLCLEFISHKSLCRHEKAWVLSRPKTYIFIGF